jgi:hypothetical protein
MVEITYGMIQFLTHQVCVVALARCRIVAVDLRRVCETGIAAGLLLV